MPRGLRLTDDVFGAGTTTEQGGRTDFGIILLLFEVL